MTTSRRSPDRRGARRKGGWPAVGSVVPVVVALLLIVPVGAAADRPGLRYFGFAGGCDTETSVQETAPFSNLCPIDLEDPRLLDQRWVAKMMLRGVKLIVATHHTFFEPIGEPVGGRQLYDLRPDHRQRWQAAIAGRGNALRALAVHFFVADEPSWNGISRSELAAADDAVKATLPWAKTVTSFSRRLDSGWFEGLDVPTDVVGYHQYRIFDPRTDPLFRTNVDLIKAHARGRAFVYVLDAWWTPEHGIAGLQREDMAEVARNYWQMAADDPDAVAMIGFHWSAPPGAAGARDLPETVGWVYRRIGSEITGKCLAPQWIQPEHALFVLGCEYFATLRFRTPDGPRFAAAMPREQDYGNWVLEEGNVVGGIKLVEGTPPTAFVSVYTGRPARIRVYETATGRLVWPVRASASADR